LARELRQRLLSTRLSHISQSAPEIVELTFYHPDRSTRTLVIAVFPLKPILFSTIEKRPALQKPPNFCRSLRKNLEYAQLTLIQSGAGERLMEFHFKTPDGVFRLIFEGIPKYPNLILVGPDNQIISALRYKNDVERLVMPQTAYQEPPQPLDRPNLWELTGGEVENLWDQADRPELVPWLKEKFRGSDAELAAHLGGFGEKAFTEWDRLKSSLSEKGLDPYLLFPGPPPSLRLFASGGPEKEFLSFGTLSQALEKLFKLEFDNQARLTQKIKLESEVAKAIKHEKRILEKLKKDRAEAEKSDQYQWWGELVMAQLHKIKLHLSETTLEDVVRGTPRKVVIPLDPEMTPLQNAQRFFKKAQKGSRGLTLVEKREKEIQERMNQLKSAQRSLPALQNLGDIKKAFLDLFPKKKEPEAKPKKAREEKVPTPNIIRTRLGKEFELCAGTSAAANDYVTFQLAQPEDLWFHVRDLPGSHVVLRKLQRNAVASSEMILQAAQLAAGHSKAKPGTKVTVSYTEKKNVKKIPGAPAGMVIMTKEKSLLVDMESIAESAGDKT
jgi:predicted ribosome quality control (RQC) complex YloA/Tae2 family protein